MPFLDRAEAGRRLAARLAHLEPDRPVVLGLPRGGVPVAYEVAHALRAPLDVVLVRKLGVPGHPEVAYGAVGEGGVRVVREDVLQAVRARPSDLERTETDALAELDRQAGRFRRDRPRLSLQDRMVVLVDDGIATGATASAACEVIAADGAARVVVAVPVAPADAVETVGDHADALVCLTTPVGFASVGEWYEDFSQTDDAQVIALIDRSRTEVGT